MVVVVVVGTTTREEEAAETAGGFGAQFVTGGTRALDASQVSCQVRNASSSSRWLGRPKSAALAV
jgi:hypothetical protein